MTPVSPNALHSGTEGDLDLDLNKNTSKANLRDNNNNNNESNSLSLIRRFISERTLVRFAMATYNEK